MNENVLECIDELGFENLGNIVSDEGDRLGYTNVFCRGKKIDGIIHWEENPKLDQLYEELRRYEIYTGISIGKLVWLCGYVQNKEMSVEDHEKLCDEVIEENPKLWNDYKNGKSVVLNSLIGKCVAKTKDKTQATTIIYKLIKEKTKIRMEVEAKVINKVKRLNRFCMDFNTSAHFFDVDKDGKVTWKFRFSKELDDIKKEVFIQIKSIQEKYSALKFATESFKFDDECWEYENWPQKKIDAMMFPIPEYNYMTGFREPYNYD